MRVAFQLVGASVVVAVLALVSALLVQPWI